MKREWNKVILNEINENKADPCSVLNRHENNSVKVSGENSMMPWIKHLEQCLVYIPVLDSFSFSPLGWPNGFVHSSEIARPCGNCRAASGPLEAGQAPGAIGAVEELAAVNRRSLVWTPPAPLERAWVIARGLSLKRRNNVKYAHTFLLYNFAH